MDSSKDSSKSKRRYGSSNVLIEEPATFTASRKKAKTATGTDGDESGSSEIVEALSKVKQGHTHSPSDAESSDFIQLVTSVKGVIHQQGSVKISGNFSKYNEKTTDLSKVMLKRVYNQSAKRVNDDFHAIYRIESFKYKEALNKANDCKPNKDKVCLPANFQDELELRTKNKCDSCGNYLTQDDPVTIGEYFKLDTAANPECFNEKVDHNATLLAEIYFWTRMEAIPVGDTRLWSPYGTDAVGTLYNPGDAGINLLELPNLLTEVSTTFQGRIQGISTPLLYAGLQNTMYVNHTENEDVGAVSVLHYGYPKIWYTIHPKDFQKFVEVSHSNISQKMIVELTGHDCPNIYRHKLLMSMITFFQKNEIEIIRHVQCKGDMIIVSGRTFHFGFNIGQNLAESVNFLFEDSINVSLTGLYCPTQTMQINMLWIMYKKRFYDVKEYLRGRLAVTDHTTGKENVPVPAPRLEISNTTDIYQEASGQLTSLMAFFSNEHGQKLVLANFDGSFHVLKQRDVETLNWIETDYDTTDTINDGKMKTITTPVKIPEEFFDWKQSFPPPQIVCANEVRVNRKNMSVFKYVKRMSNEKGKRYVPNVASNSHPFSKDDLPAVPDQAQAIVEQLPSKSTILWPKVKKPSKYFEPCGKLKTVSELVNLEKCPFPNCKKKRSEMKDKNNWPRHIQDCFDRGMYKCMYSECIVAKNLPRNLIDHMKNVHGDFNASIQIKTDGSCTYRSKNGELQHNIMDK